MMETTLLEFVRFYLLCGISGVFFGHFLWKAKFTLRAGIAFVFTWPLFLFYCVFIVYIAQKLKRKKSIMTCGVITPEAKAKLNAMFNSNALLN